jgi:competence protein ComEA
MLRFGDPPPPGKLVPVATANGCVLSVQGNGPACRCGDLSSRVRWALGLPLRLGHSDLEDLSLLPGIGPALAGRIVDDRRERGAFTTVDELVRVRGIGARTVERLRPYLVVGRDDPVCAVQAESQELS